MKPPSSPCTSPTDEPHRPFRARSRRYSAACHGWPHHRIVFFLLRNHIIRGAWKRKARHYLARRNTIADVVIDGIRMRCHLANNRTEQLIAERRHHHDLQSVRKATAFLTEGNIFVDVGANCGLFTLFAAREIGPLGTVIAIEPLPVLFRRLSYNITANGLHNIHIAHSAVGPANGTCTLHAVDNQLGQTSVAIQAGTPVDVPMTTLSQIAADFGLPRIDALKIDIEGFEDQALIPFLETSQRNLWPRRIFIEVSHRTRWKTDCIAKLHRLGYNTAWQNETDVLLMLPLTPRSAA